MKPLSSRPANSERFFVGFGLKQRHPSLANFLLEVNSIFAEKQAPHSGLEVLLLPSLMLHLSYLPTWTDCPLDGTKCSAFKLDIFCSTEQYSHRQGLNWVNQNKKSDRIC